MSTVYLQRSDDRQAFVTTVFERFDVLSKATGRKVLLKPNMVSREPYPTTTHPATLEACLQLLQGTAGEIMVADGPAWDAGDSRSIIDGHHLKRSCDRLGVPLVDLLSSGTKRVKTRTFELEVARMAFEYDLIISLPALKAHGVCDMTGALKNQYGFLSLKEKKEAHFSGAVHEMIAEFNEVIRPGLYIVDAVKTLVGSNEVRHGGKPGAPGCMLAGTDPVSLDMLGFHLLSEIDPGLKRKSPREVLHLQHAVELGLGEPEYDIVEC